MQVGYAWLLFFPVTCLPHRNGIRTSATRAYTGKSCMWRHHPTAKVTKKKDKAVELVPSANDLAGLDQPSPSKRNRPPRSPVKEKKALEDAIKDKDASRPHAIVSRARATSHGKLGGLVARDHGKMDGLVARDRAISQGSLEALEALVAKDKATSHTAAAAKGEKSLKDSSNTAAAQFVLPKLKPVHQASGVQQPRDVAAPTMKRQRSSDNNQ
eukprot:g4353.t1